jgi:WbqC-like protein family
VTEVSTVTSDIILKSYTLPPIGYFSLLKKQAKVFIDVHENYQKRSFRNKYIILAANGAMPLSIPLRQGKNNGQNIKEVRIAYEDNWIKRHLETLKSSYGKSAYVEHYFPIFQSVFEKKFTSLYDLNNALLNTLIAQLKLDTIIAESADYCSDFTLPTIAPTPYPQVFEDKYGFVAELSIIDLLFNMGPESKQYF